MYEEMKTEYDKALVIGESVVGELKTYDTELYKGQILGLYIESGKIYVGSGVKSSSSQDLEIPVICLDNVNVDDYEGLKVKFVRFGRVSKEALAQLNFEPLLKMARAETPEITEDEVREAIEGLISEKYEKFAENGIYIVK